MRYLLDTHILLWWLNEDKSLDEKTKDIIADPNNLIFISAASAWEITLKKSLGKLRVPSHLKETLVNGGFELLAITIDHCEALEKLPDHHRDPFDRILIAQAQLEKMTLMTHDEQFKNYKNVDLLLI